jgi:hypothetical protein
MIERRLTNRILEALNEGAAMALLGPRQSGKTTLALEVGRRRDSVYLDLESASDRARLAEPELYLSSVENRLVILDEVHRVPGLFPVLRGLIDRGRRKGLKTGRFLLLGSASLDLLKQSGETLAGRITFMELGPLDVLEVHRHALDVQWLRGGFPESLLAKDGPGSLRWRQSFIRTYLERDIPQFGPRISPETLRRFWTMLAHHQGGLLNTAQFARNLGVDIKTAAGYLDLLAGMFLVRKLAPWHANLGKRLVKSPKVYLRDSGILHALLGIPDLETLLAHPVLGASWEGFAIENLIAVLPEGVVPYFYRTSGGAEVDLVLAWPKGEIWAIEVKRSLAPRPERGFHSAREDLRPAKSWVVYPGMEQFPVAEGVEAVPLPVLARMLQG